MATQFFGPGQANPDTVVVAGTGEVDQEVPALAVEYNSPRPPARQVPFDWQIAAAKSDGVVALVGTAYFVQDAPASVVIASRPPGPAAMQVAPPQLRAATF